MKPPFGWVHIVTTAIISAMATGIFMQAMSYFVVGPQDWVAVGVNSTTGNVVVWGTFNSQKEIGRWLTDESNAGSESAGWSFISKHLQKPTFTSENP